jgi:MFS family permease
VTLLGLASAIGALALFAAAQTTLWPSGARVLQGLAVGMISGAATAALVELDPDDDRRADELLRARPRPTSTSRRSTGAAPDERLFG